MSKIIKSSMGRGDVIVSYERSMLENLEGVGGTETDPAAVLARAREEAEEKVQAAYAEGLRRGEEAGRKHFDESIGKASEMLEQAAKALVAAREDFFRKTTPHLVQLAGQIAEQILGREAQVSPEVVETAAYRILECLVDQESVTLHIAPEDLEAVRNHRVELLEKFEGLKTLQIVGDDSIAPGECVGDSGALVADGLWRNQIAQILEQILEDD